MGNISKINSSSLEKNNILYSSKYAGKIPRDGHSDEWMNQFVEHIHNWVTGIVDGRTPESFLTDEEIEYVERNMKYLFDSDISHLTRVENPLSSGILDENGNLTIHEGDKLPSNSKYRSYSKGAFDSINYAADKPYPLAIIRTNGNIKYFDVDKVDMTYFQESETWVHHSNLKVDSIQRIRKQDYDDLKDGSYKYHGEKVDYKYSDKFDSAVAEALNTSKPVYDIFDEYPQYVPLKTSEVIIIDVSE